MGKSSTKRVIEYARLAMGFANVRAGTRVLMLVLVLVLVQALGAGPRLHPVLRLHPDHERGVRRRRQRRILHGSGYRDGLPDHGSAGAQELAFRARV